ncbi:hypothetical protein FB451DRAFT_1182951 [Mycena latifolia]|nr:hypothetical protein FB451DRAFT_1182951 [Mycena latifolia]
MSTESSRSGRKAPGLYTSHFTQLDKKDDRSNQYHGSVTIVAMTMMGQVPALKVAIIIFHSIWRIAENARVLLQLRGRTLSFMNKKKKTSNWIPPLGGNDDDTGEDIVEQAFKDLQKLLDDEAPIAIPHGSVIAGEVVDFEELERLDRGETSATDEDNIDIVGNAAAAGWSIQDLMTRHTISRQSCQFCRILPPFCLPFCHCARLNHSENILPPTLPEDRGQACLSPCRRSRTQHRARASAPFTLAWLRTRRTARNRCVLNAIRGTHSWIIRKAEARTRKVDAPQTRSAGEYGRFRHRARLSAEFQHASHQYEPSPINELTPIAGPTDELCRIPLEISRRYSTEYAPSAGLQRGLQVQLLKLKLCDSVRTGGIAHGAPALLVLGRRLVDFGARVLEGLHACKPGQLRKAHASGRARAHSAGVAHPCLCTSLRAGELPACTVACRSQAHAAALHQRR